jgi:hypothetical protein
MSDGVAVSRDKTKALVFRIATIAFATTSVGIFISFSIDSFRYPFLGFPIGVVMFIVMCFLKKWILQYIFFCVGTIVVSINTPFLAISWSPNYGLVVFLLLLAINNIILAALITKRKVNVFLYSSFGLIFIASAFYFDTDYLDALDGIIWISALLANICGFVFLKSKQKESVAESIQSVAGTPYPYPTPAHQYDVRYYGENAEENGWEAPESPQNFAYYDAQQGPASLDVPDQYHPVTMHQSQVGPSAQEKPLSDRLQELKKLHAQELIDEDEYQTLRQRLLDEL